MVEIAQSRIAAVVRAVSNRRQLTTSTDGVGRKNAGLGARTSESAALRKHAQFRSAPTARSFSPPKLLVLAMFGMKPRPPGEGDPLRARRPALLGRFGARSHIRCSLWDSCEIFSLLSEVR